MSPIGGGRLAFRPDERRKVAEVIKDMDAEHRSGKEESRPTIYSVVARLHAIRNHPIARRKKSYLEPLVEILLDERAGEILASSEAPDPGLIPGDTVMTTAEVDEGQPAVVSNADAAAATDLSTTAAAIAAENGARKPEDSPGRARRQQRPKGEGGSERAANGRRVRKRRRARSESGSGSDYEHKKTRTSREGREGRESGEDNDGKAVAPTPIPPNGPKVDDISGMDDVLLKLLHGVWAPLQPGYYSNQPVLLYGPSGCGKTLVANAVAAATGAHFFPVSGPDIIAGVSGESEGNIRKIFDAAIRMAPSLIFIDDIEAIAGKQEQPAKGTAGTMEGRMALTLKNCIDRLEWETADGRNVVVLAATSDANNLNPLVRRRFDIEIAVSVPSQDARERILRTMTRGMALADDVDLAEIALMTPGFVGGDLKNVVKTARSLKNSDMIDDKLAQLRMEAAAAAAAAATAANGDTKGLINGDSSSSSSSSSSSQNAAAAYRLLSQDLATGTGSGSAGEADATAVATADAADATAAATVPSIRAQSFREATQKVVPAAKREGFSTIPDTTWKQVGAMSAVREQLETSIIWPIKYPHKYAAVGLDTVGGILLWGPPGCGKTLVAKAVANESKANFISIRGPELLNKYVGESERALRELFERARAMTPCVIFFDEMDALAAKRDDGRSDGSARIVNTLLTELDGLVDRSGIYVIGATNRLDIIDPAIKRPGRLGESIFVGPPSADDRVSILQTLCRNAAPPGDAAAPGTPEAARQEADSLQLLADVARDPRCSGFSGADLDHLRRNASIYCLKRTNFEEKSHITRQDWEAALRDTKPSISPAALERYKKSR